MKIFIDDSIHNEFGFMLLSYVICKEDPQEHIQNILNEFGLDEFHARTKMKNNETHQKLRSRLSRYFQLNCKWGVFVLPDKFRHSIFQNFDYLLNQLCEKYPNQSMEINIDQGVITKEEALKYQKKYTFARINVCDSKKVNGIQLADLIAGIAGTRLREEISDKPAKMIDFGGKSGYAEGTMIPLGYELWAKFRYEMLHSGVAKGEDYPEMAMFDTEGHGLIISLDCCSKLKEASQKVFGTIYFGCIH